MYEKSSPLSGKPERQLSNLVRCQRAEEQSVAKKKMKSEEESGWKSFRLLISTGAWFKLHNVSSAGESANTVSLCRARWLHFDFKGSRRMRLTTSYLLHRSDVIFLPPHTLLILSSEHRTRVSTPLIYSTTLFSTRISSQMLHSNPTATTTASLYLLAKTYLHCKSWQNSSQKQSFLKQNISGSDRNLSYSNLFDFFYLFTSLHSRVCIHYDYSQFLTIFFTVLFRSTRAKQTHN